MVGTERRDKAYHWVGSRAPLPAKNAGLRSWEPLGGNLNSRIRLSRGPS